MDVDDDMPTKGPRVRNVQVHKTVDPKIDLGLLLCEDQQPIEKTGRLSAEELNALSRDNVQCVINELWKLPTKRVEDAIVVTLPKVSLRMPREKPIPKPKAPTRWESYAKEKGIQNKTKSKLVWDEVTQSWKPRFGYRRAQHETEQNWMMEVPGNATNEDLNKDLFGAKQDQKRERVAKNSLQRMKNAVRGSKPMNANYEPLNQVPTPTGVGMNLKNKSAQELGRQLERAKHSTASLGKFTDGLRGERAPKNSGKKRQFAPNETTTKSERASQLKVLDKLNKKRPRLDVNAAVSHETVSMEKSNSEGDKKRHSKANRSFSQNKRQKFNSRPKGASSTDKGKTPSKKVKAAAKRGGGG